MLGDSYLNLHTMCPQLPLAYCHSSCVLTQRWHMCTMACVKQAPKWAPLCTAAARLDGLSTLQRVQLTFRAQTQPPTHPELLLDRKVCLPPALHNPSLMESKTELDLKGRPLKRSGRGKHHTHLQRGSGSDKSGPGTQVFRLDASNTCGLSGSRGPLYLHASFGPQLRPPVVPIF